ncbi:MAG TPA: TlpA disulfide reductase family protein [Arenimonas sp.]|nr:TlpA disulfide reductase family protein [Arenimonas sp.]
MSDVAARPPYALWLGLLALAAGFGAFGWWAGQRALLPAEKAPPAGVVETAIGEAIPALMLTDLRSGHARTLAAGGRPRLINYWASWCGPCREEMPVLDAFAAAERGNGVEVVGIALDTLEDARAFIVATPVAFDLLQEDASERDSSVRLGNRRGVLPFSVLVDAEGRLIKRHYGAFRDGDEASAWVRGEN